MTFTEKMKYLRKRTGKSQLQVSNEIGIAISSLRNYENGRFPDTVQLKQIKEYYGVTYEYLLDDNINNPNPDNINIGKELGFSDLTIEKIKELKDTHLQDKFNIFLENFNIYSFAYYVSEINLLNEQLITNLYFLIKLYDFTSFLKDNMHKKVTKKVSTFFSLFDTKMYNFYKFVEKNKETITFIKLEECINFRNSLRQVQSSFLEGNYDEMFENIILYTNICSSIIEEMNIFIEFDKYSLQNLFIDFTHYMFPNYTDFNSFYYKDLKGYYKYSENGFSENLINKFERVNKKDFLFNEALYTKDIIEPKKNPYNNIRKVNNK